MHTLKSLTARFESVVEERLVRRNTFVLSTTISGSSLQVEREDGRSQIDRRRIYCREGISLMMASSARQCSSFKSKSEASQPTMSRRLGWLQ
jgi:hypothetical protein